jgi:hypothetical protein
MPVFLPLHGQQHRVTFIRVPVLYVRVFISCGLAVVLFTV